MHSEEAKVYTAILIAACILTTILIFFIITLLVHRKKNEQLHAEKISAEINTLENERKRLAHDLHDEVAMLLSVAKLQLSCIDNMDEETEEYVTKASGHIDTSLMKIREIISDLMPSALVRKGVVAALKELFDSINDTNTLQIEYSFPEENIVIPDQVGVHVFRSVQEIVHNTIKHSKASSFTFNLQAETKHIYILTADDGVGFDPTEDKKRSGLGLRSIVSRIELLDGTIYVNAEKQKGVSYEISIPLTSIA